MACEVLRRARSDIGFRRFNRVFPDLAGPCSTKVDAELKGGQFTEENLPEADFGAFLDPSLMDWRE